MTFWLWAFAALGVLLVAAVVVAAMLESMLRLAAMIERTILVRPVRRRDFLASAYHPYVDWVEDWAKPMFSYIPVGLRLYNLENPIPQRVQNNSLGFRCDEFLPPQPDVLRVLIIGGSAAWGSGASSNAHTIAGQLERVMNSDRRLLEGRRSAKCYNLAQVNGYQTQDLLTLLLFAPRLAPHIVISFTGWNELMANDMMRRDLLERYGVFYMNEMDGWQPPDVVGRRTRELQESFWIWAREHSEVVRRFKPPHVSSEEREPIQRRIELGTTLFLSHLDIIERLAKAYGFVHLQVLQPYLYRKRTLTPQEQNVIRLYDEVRPVHGGRATGDYLRATNIYAPLKEVLERQGRAARLLDLSDVFREDEGPIFYTLVHMNDEGYRRIAEEMHAALLRIRDGVGVSLEEAH